jgi:NAD(P)-dependent dehydrogenase (short-subunit alcohol dehydrogenase family)
MPGRLQGKIAIVTGGGRGLGKAIALAYSGEGAKVIITSAKHKN